MIEKTFLRKVLAARLRPTPLCLRNLFIAIILADVQDLKEFNCLLVLKNLEGNIKQLPTPCHKQYPAICANTKSSTETNNDTNFIKCEAGKSALIYFHFCKAYLF